MYKVMFHLNNQERAEDTLNNIKNLLKDIDEDIQVKLVVHSNGILSFKKDRNTHKKEIMNLLDKGVQIELCTNTLDKLDLKLEDFFPGIKMVSSAIGELVRKEKEGWLYIKP